MATYYARKTGNINANDVWATTPGGTAGAQTFVAGDILVANSFTITVNVSTDLGNGTVTNDNRDGATAGGLFSLANGVTLTANVQAGNVGAACVSTASSVSATIVGNITGGTTVSSNGVSHGSSGTLNVVGNVVGGTQNAAMGISHTGGGGLTMTGNVTGGSGGTSFGVSASASGPAVITGTVSGGTASPGLFANGTSTVSVVGVCIGGAGGAAFGFSHGNTSAVVTITRARGGSAMGSGAGVAGPTSGVGSVSVQEIEYGDLGASPTTGSVRLTDSTANVAIMYRPNTSKKTLVDANASGLMPAASNVRSGVVYNGGNSTGTCAVPAAGSVALGVPVDNTTGTAVLTSSVVQSACDAAMAARNVATLASVGQQLADALTLPT